MARLPLVFLLLALSLLAGRAQIASCPGTPTSCGGLARGICFAANDSVVPSCQCVEGWTGPDCSTPDCPGGCPANAYCEPLLNPPACLCNTSLNATGVDCTEVDFGCPGEPDCTDNVTNGICNTTTSQCMCLRGWTGPACNVPALCPLGPNNYTCTGNGDCVPNDVGFHYCRCYVGWVGDACESSVCDLGPGLNCSYPDGECTSVYPPRCHCTGYRKGGQLCDRTDQTADFELAPITKGAAFGIAVALTFVSFLILGIVVYLERTRWQCLTKREREEDAAYARLEAARKLADQAPANRDGKPVNGSATQASSAAGSTAALVDDKGKEKDKKQKAPVDDDDGL